MNLIFKSISQYIKIASTLSFLLLSIVVFSKNEIPCEDNLVFATIDRGPYLQNLTSTSVVIKWRTNVPTQSIVRYGTSLNNLNSVESNAAPKEDHEIEVTGTVGTKYYYQIEENAGVLVNASSNMYFQLAPAIGSKTALTAWILGDAGTGNDNARNVRNAFYSYMGNNHTDMILFLGDNAYNSGTDPEYQNAVFSNMYEDLMKQTVSWSCLGNHDGYTANSSNQSGAYYDIFTFPKTGEAGGVASGTEAYYSFDYANVHFIVLESYETNRNVGGSMYNWAQMDIQDTSQDWIVALWHHPPYTKGSHDSDDVEDSDGSMRDMRENFLPMLEANGVDLVLSGHSHSYERSYFVNGHYENSTTFNQNQHTIPIGGNGSGQANGSGEYEKNICTEGSVYITTGSAGKITGSGSLNHPVMYYSAKELGSVVMEVEGTTMDVKFLRENGSVDDFFTIEKEVVGSVCDDGNPNTHFDMYDNSCNCVGVTVAQCNDGDDFNISEFTVVSNRTSIPGNESSGLTTTNNGNEFYVVSDAGGRLIEINENGNQQFIIPSLPCRDLESVTFIKKMSATTNRFAVSEERSRVIYFIDINTVNNSVTTIGTISISGVSGICGGNNQGLEAIAYDPESNTMYFGEQDDRIIKKFTLPTTINNQTVSATQIVDVRSINNLNTCTLAGMDVMPSGNILLLLTNGNCQGDSGLYPRKLVEIDPCGNFVEQFDLESITANNYNTDELEGVAVIEGHIYLVGENQVLYDLVRNLPSSITVNSPGTGDVYNPGDQFNILWGSQNVSGNVKIDLYKGNNIIMSISNSTDNDNQFSSNIPPNTAFGTDYRIRITSLDNPTINDFGNNFTIEAGPSITVESPGSGDVFSPGNGITVTWSSNNISGNVKIELYRSTTFVSNLILSTPNDNVQSVLLPSSNVPTNNNYRIKITSITNGNVMDFGDVFTIQLAPSITVTNPGSSDVYSPGEAFTVDWNSANLSGNVKIELFNGTNFNRVLTSNTANDGTANFTFLNTMTAGSNYRIKITSLTNSTIFDFGNNFTIQLTPTITVTNPTQNDQYVIGQSIPITWSSMNLIGNVSIKLNNGASLVTVISPSTADDGNFSYILPSSLSPGINYNIEVSSLNNPSVTALSGVFSIDPFPSITVLNPGAGDSFNPGQSISVQWESVGVTSNVNIKFAKGSALISTLTLSTTNDGQQSFTLPSSLVNGTNYRIFIQSNTGTIVSDYGDFFTITNTCPEDLVIANATNANVNQEAASTISSNQVVLNSNTASYHAGDEVLMTDGFLAQTGSIFRAYIEGCTGNFQSVREDDKTANSPSSKE